jgi:hypothetical protein
MAYLILFCILGVLWLPMIIDAYRYYSASVEEWTARETWERDQKLAGLSRPESEFGGYGGDGGGAAASGCGGAAGCS